ncbi:hypothetical protein H9661_00405 [Clostridium sp. Sa3CVN1]|uniref:Uncharacterized protein n=2 Tax=Clostridiaceae TaxID=31979 RepID=A0ABR8PNS9_9CLOT|nr:hypothetical protein [Clostridium cibarium]
MAILILAGLTRVNIINTKALSPLDNTNENYEKISEAFGEEFSNFIKDNALIKIYKDDLKEVLVRVGGKDFKIKKESSLIEGAEKAVENIGDFFCSVRDKIEKVII